MRHSSTTWSHGDICPLCTSLFLSAPWQTWQQRRCLNPTTLHGRKPCSMIQTSLKLSNWECLHWTHDQSSLSTNALTGEKTTVCVYFLVQSWERIWFTHWSKLQGCYSVWWLWQSYQRNHIQTPWGGPEPTSVPGAPGAGNEAPHLQQDSPGMDIRGHTSDPTHRYTGAHQSPRVWWPVEGHDVGWAVN